MWYCFVGKNFVVCLSTTKTTKIPPPPPLSLSPSPPSLPPQINLVHDVPCSGTVRAKTHCDILLLSKSSVSQRVRETPLPSLPPSLTPYLPLFFSSSLPFSTSFFSLLSSSIPPSPSPFLPPYLPHPSFLHHSLLPDLCLLIPYTIPRTGFNCILSFPHPTHSCALSPSPLTCTFLQL